MEIYKGTLIIRLDELFADLIIRWMDIIHNDSCERLWQNRSTQMIITEFTTDRKCAKYSIKGQILQYNHILSYSMGIRGRPMKKTYRVPYLQLDGLVFDRHHTRPEFHANGQIMHGLKPFVCELQQQTRLPNTYVHSQQKKSTQNRRIQLAKSFEQPQPAAEKPQRLAVKSKSKLLVTTCITDDDILKQVRVRHGVQHFLPRKPTKPTPKTCCTRKSHHKEYRPTQDQNARCDEKRNTQAASGVMTGKTARWG